MRLVFLGTPHFAVPTLDAVVQAGHEVVAVYTQPDRPKGRGQELAFSPVKEAALRLGLEVRQPERVRRCVEELAALESEAMVVVGYGQIIPQAIIDLPRHGIINVHASLLPKYRGAGPIQWAIANGETVTGVTTMMINAGLDTGDMLLKAETPIGPEETALEVGPRLAALGAELLVRTLDGLLAGAITRVPQNDAESSLAPILKREDGLIDWTQPAAVIHNRARGFLPWPGAWTTFRGVRFNVWRCRVASEPVGHLTPGALYATGKKLFAACGASSALELLEIQVEGRKRVDAAAFLNGQRLSDTDILGESSK
ncbi:methionyl-tRNA formyltransferase [uncultured Paludibaculum sp.]|uniref:methionyl-tRNA formyltransferase n=1 Tax=uncultured Paludibaculum sp. TaxID=1765020 RepID=UPI002AAA9249|nr:methionyl-tRNA formyltransferase [uncultured Paludibaculum sp.]